MMSENKDFYFWLGADGEAYELTEEEFEHQVEKKRKQREDWLNVEIDS